MIANKSFPMDARTPFAMAATSPALSAAHKHNVECTLFRAPDGHRCNCIEIRNGSEP
jgi:hypothetical protein